MGYLELYVHRSRVRRFALLARLHPKRGTVLAGMTRETELRVERRDLVLSSLLLLILDVVGAGLVICRVALGGSEAREG